MIAAAPWVAACVALLAGIGAGVLHFQSLGALAGRIVGGDRRALWLQLLRLAAMTGFLVLAAQGGALVLLAAAGGVLIGRWMVLRTHRRGAP